MKHYYLSIALLISSMLYLHATSDLLPKQVDKRDVELSDDTILLEELIKKLHDEEFESMVRRLDTKDSFVECLSHAYNLLMEREKLSDAEEALASRIVRVMEELGYLLQPIQSRSIATNSILVGDSLRVNGKSVFYGPVSINSEDENPALVVKGNVLFDTAFIDILNANSSSFGQLSVANLIRIFDEGNSAVIEQSNPTRDLAIRVPVGSAGNIALTTPNNIDVLAGNGLALRGTGIVDLQSANGGVTIHAGPGFPTAGPGSVDIRALDTVNTIAGNDVLIGVLSPLGSVNLNSQHIRLDAFDATFIDLGADETVNMGSGGNFNVEVGADLTLHAEGHIRETTDTGGVVIAANAAPPAPVAGQVSINAAALLDMHGNAVELDAPTDVLIEAGNEARIRGNGDVVIETTNSADLDGIVLRSASNMTLQLGDLIGFSNNLVLNGIRQGIGAALSLEAGTNAIVSAVSSRRFKDKITPLMESSAILEQLQPVEYILKGALPRKQIGLVAEDVYELLPHVVPLDAEGLPLNVQYDNLVALVIKGWQEQQAEIKELKAKVAALESKKVKKHKN